MPSAEKVERVEELKDRIEGSNALLLAEYRGLTVADISDLRRSLFEGGARLAVVKNTLMRRAAAAALADIESLLEGPTAVAFVAGDPVAAAKKIVDAMKRFPSLVLKGGWVEGRLLTADQARSLADLESREAMLSKVAGMLKSEMSRAAFIFQAAQARFLSVLEAYKEKVPEPESSSAEPTSSDASQPSDETAAEATASPGADGGSESDSTSSADAFTESESESGGAEINEEEEQ